MNKGVEERLNEAYNYLKSKRCFKTQEEAAALIGSTRPNLSKALNGNKDFLTGSFIDRFVSAFSDTICISKDWLLTGEGEMLSSDATGTPSTESDDANYKLVPLLNLDSVGGVWSSNEVVDTAEYVESLVPFTDAQDGDIAVFQSGNSMTPTIPPGSLLLLRKVENWQDYIGYGSICVLLLRDGRRITKEIQAYRPDTQNYLLCVSHKEDIAEEPLPKRLIVGVWKVIKVLVNHGW